MKIINFLFQYERTVGLILLLAMGAHQIWGQMKWQYYPLYFLAILYIILLATQYFIDYSLTPSMSRWLLGSSVFLVLLSMLSIIAFPKPKMPEPTGSFAIGTQTFEQTDRTRLEAYSDEPDDYRKVKYQLWYPTDSTENLERAQWIEEGTLVTRQLIRNLFLPMPPFILDQTATVAANAFVDAPLSITSDKYPVVLLSHGWKSFRELHVDYAEELASHGFIVVAMDHTYGSQAVQFADGEVAYINKEALPSGVSDKVFAQAAHELAVTYGEDVQLILDELEQLNSESSMFQGKIDQENIGLLGHSTGGAGAVYTALDDQRIQALIGLDAWVNPLDQARLRQGLTIPSLFFRSEQWGKRENKEPLNIMVQESGQAQIIEMAEAKHLDYPMTYMFSPYTELVGLTGEFGGREGAVIQKEIILDFFQQHLTDQEIAPDYLQHYLQKYKKLELTTFD